MYLTYSLEPLFSSMRGCYKVMRNRYSRQRTQLSWSGSFRLSGLCSLQLCIPSFIYIQPTDALAFLGKKPTLAQCLKTLPLPRCFLGTAASWPGIHKLREIQHTSPHKVVGWTIEKTSRAPSSRLLLSTCSPLNRMKVICTTWPTAR
jgi:hypothetical protein